MTSSTASPPRPVVLCILDGWGLAPPGPDNAIALADTPIWDRLMRDYPRGELQASEMFVGLPAGQMGNSEVGHMNIGAGRVVMQDLPRIDAAVADGTLAANPALIAFADTLKASGGVAHLLGLVSPGGVHAHQDHIAALAKALAERGVPVALHAFLDGRDTPPQSARLYVDRLEADLAGTPGVRIATVGGRFYAMDRDKRWDRLQTAFANLVHGDGRRAGSAADAITDAYARGETDEFVAPTVIGDYAGMRDGDGVLMANFRADRARQLLHALLDPGFDAFPRPGLPRFAAALGMVEYSTELTAFLPALFGPVALTETLGEVVAKAGLTQLRLAESEKYAHVTFFLNGGEERIFPGEHRILVPSPKVKTYDLAPAMSAAEVTGHLLAAIRGRTHDLIVVNYANGDQVGHSGALAAAIQAAETVDACLEEIVAAVESVGGAMIITADHGNAEQMWDASAGAPHTQHTLNPVPAILVGGPSGVTSLASGRLSDLAPTLLALLGLPQPAAMTGQVLLRPSPARS